MNTDSSPTQSPQESEDVRAVRLPSVLKGYAKDIDKYGRPLDSGLAEILRFAAKRIRATEEKEG